MDYKKIYKRHEEKLKFLIIGGWNTLFGYLIFIAFYYFLNKIIHYLILLVISYIVSITNAYLSYKFFVFKTKGNYIRGYLRFYLVYGVAFLVNIALMPLFVEFIGVNPIIAQGIILFFTVSIGYIGHKNYSFNVSAAKNLN
jgi:putative flippase GtrA